MRLYLDNCCYNRPYDDMRNANVALEAQAKLIIQDLIRKGSIELSTSYVLEYENSKNPYEMRKIPIYEFMKRYKNVYVNYEEEKNVNDMACDIIKTGVRYVDACHVACAIISRCDYFLTTDYRLLRYKTKEIRIMNPIDFIKIIGGLVYGYKF